MNLDISAAPLSATQPEPSVTVKNPSANSPNRAGPSTRGTNVNIRASGGSSTSLPTTPAMIVGRVAGDPAPWPPSPPGRLERRIRGIRVSGSTVLGNGARLDGRAFTCPRGRDAISRLNGYLHVGAHNRFNGALKLRTC